MLVLHQNQVFLPSSPLQGCRQEIHQPFLSFPTSDSLPPMGSLVAIAAKKGKVIFVMGATGTGKSKLAIALAARFNGEIVNSDKMQVYDGLPIVTNKVTVEELAAVPHHLIGGVHPDADFTAAEFRREAMRAIEDILARGRLPIVAGGSNSYIEYLVDGEEEEFRSKYECCFLWVDVEQEVLHVFVAERVNQMVEMGVVDEMRGVFVPDADYTRGVRRSIGVPEMDAYYRAEKAGQDSGALTGILSACIDEMKANTCKLTISQVAKIQRLRNEVGWDIHRLDCTPVFQRYAEWDVSVFAPALSVVRDFLEVNEEAQEETNELGTVQYPATAYAAANDVAATTVEPVGATN